MHQPQAKPNLPVHVQTGKLLIWLNAHIRLADRLDESIVRRKVETVAILGLDFACHDVLFRMAKDIVEDVSQLRVIGRVCGWVLARMRL